MAIQVEIISRESMKQTLKIIDFDLQIKHSLKFICIVFAFN